MFILMYGPCHVIMDGPSQSQDLICFVSSGEIGKDQISSYTGQISFFGGGNSFDLYKQEKWKFQKCDYERVTANTAVRIPLYLKRSKVGGEGGVREKLCDIYINLWLYTKEGL